MTPVERERIRFRALAVLRDARWATERYDSRINLDDLITESSRHADLRAETAAIVAVAQVLRARDLSWAEFFTPVLDLGADVVRVILAEAEEVLRRA